jgi:ethanolamine utilization protein EutQ
MAEVKLFRRKDLDLAPKEGHAVLGLVNASYSRRLGGGIGVFNDADIPWTCTYDEILFILEGRMTIRVEGKGDYIGGPGDTIWIPKGVPIVYRTKGACTFFYAVCPVGNSPSTSKTIAYPTHGPTKA